MPFPPSGNLPDPGMEPASPVPCALTGRFYSTEPPGKTYLSIPSLPLTILMRFTQPYSVINPSWYIYHDGCCSVFLNCRPTLCNPMDCSKPGFSVHHHLLEPGDAIQPSDPVIPFSSCLQSLPASGSFLMSQLFAWGGQSTGASASASSFQWIFTIDFLWDWLGWSSAAQSINSLALSLLYGPTLTSIHDHRKNHTFHLRDLLAK